jgi:hypothetical protein
MILSSKATKVSQLGTIAKFIYFWRNFFSNFHICLKEREKEKKDELKERTNWCLGSHANRHKEIIEKDEKNK